jgi:cytidine deaminase
MLAQNLGPICTLHALDTPPPEPTASALLAAALAARAQAYAPYSRFAVGAALLDEQGRIHTGCNVENAAYPEGLCAEAVALGQLVLAGGTRVTAVLVAADSRHPVTPCGGCRQKLREFAAAGVPVWSADTRGVTASHTLGELLPASFGPDHLGTR